MAKAKKKTKKTRTYNRIDSNAKIKILVKGNPKRKGTAAHKHFAKLRSGMTVGNARALGINVQWNVAHDVIKLISAKKKKKVA